MATRRLPLADGKTIWPLVGGVVACAIALWLGLLHGYYPARRIRTLFAVVVLFALVLLVRKHRNASMMYALLMPALLLGGLGTVSGSTIAFDNRLYEQEWQNPYVRTVYRLDRQCLPFGLPPCHSYVMALGASPPPYRLTQECIVPYFLCMTKVTIVDVRR